MPKHRLVDRYNRHLNYLRISITDRCNLRCIYCVPRETIQRLTHDEVLRYEEILRLVRLGVRMGIDKIRVTGGEPLVRKGVFDFLTKLARTDGLKELTLTTNGMLLAEHIEEIQQSGIQRLNISLDTLDREKYRRITGVDGFERVWEGIAAADEKGFRPIKLNVVALRGVNDDELLAFAKLTFKYPYHIRFIEYMPIGKDRMQFGPALLVPEIKRAIESIGELTPLKRNSNYGPAERFRLKGAKGEIGFISALSHHFCSNWNRLRLTAGGQLRPCLLSDFQVDLKSALRSGATDQELSEIFFEAVRNKPSDHTLSIDNPSGVSCQMSSIGG
jgi:cyclic pyranopterin phosphate synthase